MAVARWDAKPTCLEPGGLEMEMVLSKIVFDLFRSKWRKCLGFLQAINLEVCWATRNMFNGGLMHSKPTNWGARRPVRPEVYWEDPGFADPWTSKQCLIIYIMIYQYKSQLDLRICQRICHWKGMSAPKVRRKNVPSVVRETDIAFNSESRFCSQGFMNQQLWFTDHGSFA